MRFAVNIKETTSDTFLVEAKNYEEAEKIVRKLYNDGKINLCYDHNCMEASFSDDTENYRKLFTDDELNLLPYVNSPVNIAFMKYGVTYENITKEEEKQYEQKSV